VLVCYIGQIDAQAQNLAKDRAQAFSMLLPACYEYDVRSIDKRLDFRIELDYRLWRKRNLQSVHCIALQGC
jgi:hypothetical protein